MSVRRMSTHPAGGVMVGLLAHRTEMEATITSLTMVPVGLLIVWVRMPLALPSDAAER